MDGFVEGIERTRHRDDGPWYLARDLLGTKFLGRGPEGSPYRLGVMPLPPSDR